MSRSFIMDMGLDTSDVKAGLQEMKDAFARWDAATEAGTDDVNAAFADVIRTVVKTGAAVGATRASVVRDLGKIGLSAEDAEDAISAVEREFQQATKAGRDMRRVGDALDDVGDKAAGASKDVSKVEDAAGKVGDGFRDLGSIARDTLNGDIGSASSTVVSALGAIAGSFGGVAGAAAAAVGEFGIGLITDALQQQQKEADEVRDRLAGAYQTAAAAGRTYLDEAAVIANAMSLMYDTDKADQYAKIQETQLQTGLDLNTVFDAAAGKLDALATVQERVTQAKRDAIAAGEEDNLLDPNDTISKLDSIASYWQNTANVAQEYGQKSATAIDYVDDKLREAIDGAQGATLEVDAFGNKLYTLPEGRQILIAADTGKATEDVSKFKGDLDGVVEEVTTKVRVIRDSSEWDNWHPGDKIGNVRTAVQGGAGGTTWY